MVARHGTVIALAVCTGASFAAAAIGSLFTTPATPGWCATLAKPSWPPPFWLFGTVWMLLYLLMGVAAWLVWPRAGLGAAALPIALFGLDTSAKCHGSARENRTVLPRGEACECPGVC